MKTVELVVLWSSFALALYACVVYPLLIGLASRFTRNEAAAPESDGTRIGSWPTVTLLIAARREENLIVNRLRNAAALNYPPDRLEILVGCDGEGDLTALLARSFEDPRVKVVQLSEQRGTAAVMNECILKATGEILVFSDVNSMMRPDALRRLVRHFQRAEVGAVCGKLLPIDPTTGRNLSGLVWKFETFVSRHEARLGALSRINSGIYAVRKSLSAPAARNGSDGRLPGERTAPKQRYRLVYDATAVAVEETPPSMEAEFRARLKSGSEARRSLRRLASSLGTRSALMVVLSRSHKRLRQLCPVFLLAAFVSNACLSNEPFYLHLLLFHELFYLSALIGLFFAAGSLWRRLLRFPLTLVRKTTRPLHPVWESSTARRKRVAEPALNGPATNPAVR
jgi:glycosyltransferase involved in cell wall biosynthesis